MTESSRVSRVPGGAEMTEPARVSWVLKFEMTESSRVPRVPGVEMTEFSRVISVPGPEMTEYSRVPKGDQWLKWLSTRESQGYQELK